MRHEHLICTVGGRVARPQETDLHPRVTGHYLADCPFDEMAEGDRLADGAQALAFGAEEHDEVLDQPIESVRLEPDIGGHGTATCRSEVPGREQLRPAVDGRHGRPELVRQDVEKGLPVTRGDRSRRRGLGGPSHRCCGQAACRPGLGWPGFVHAHHDVARLHDAMV